MRHLLNPKNTHIFIGRSSSFSFPVFSQMVQMSLNTNWIIDCGSEAHCAIFNRDLAYAIHQIGSHTNFISWVFSSFLSLCKIPLTTAAWASSNNKFTNETIWQLLFSETFFLSSIEIVFYGLFSLLSSINIESHAFTEHRTRDTGTLMDSRFFHYEILTRIDVDSIAQK